MSPLNTRIYRLAPVFTAINSKQMDRRRSMPVFGGPYQDSSKFYGSNRGNRELDPRGSLTKPDRLWDYRKLAITSTQVNN